MTARSGYLSARTASVRCILRSATRVQVLIKLVAPVQHRCVLCMHLRGSDAAVYVKDAPPVYLYIYTSTVARLYVLLISFSITQK